jgi:hypothetical protein
VEQRFAVPGAASVRLRALLAGPALTGTVVHTGADATYVDLGDRVVGVLSSRAVHVPCGIRTALPTLPALPRSAPVVAGDGVLAIGPLRVHVARLVDVIPQPWSRGSQARTSTWARTSAAVGAELPASALAALRAGDPAAVAALLGRGSGLTPLGDDVLCGWLATSRLVEDPARPAVAAEALRLAPGRTTRLSAELVACAVDGEVVPQFRRLLTALAVGAGVDGALAALLDVGHTSGAGLALGCRLSLEADHGRRAAA